MSDSSEHSVKYSAEHYHDTSPNQFVNKSIIIMLGTKEALL